MAPETLQQGKVSTKSDVYSFGIILWEMLTRDKPYEGMGLYRVLEGVTKGLRSVDQKSQIVKSLIVLSEFLLFRFIGIGRRFNLAFAC